MIKKLKKEQLLMMALFGILLVVLAIPVPKDNENEKEEKNMKTQETKIGTENQESESRLEEILGKISGVGEVEVFITYRDGGRVVVEKDETLSEELVEETDSVGGTRRTTTVQTEKQTIFDQENTPYVIQEMTPMVEGVLVVAEGGGNEAIKKQIENTIKALFGLETHKISIMKMEVLK